jgi:hypothetical protein
MGDGVCTREPLLPLNIGPLSSQLPTWSLYLATEHRGSGVGELRSSDYCGAAMTKME